jgi:acyl-CoA synthetase (AMP-forming)/AMP-acid ligase II
LAVTDNKGIHSDPLNTFFAALDRYADQPALHWRGREHSYHELLGSVADWESRLASEGVREGSVVGVLGDYWPDVVACVLGLMRQNAIIVPFSEGTGPELNALAEMAEVEFMVRFDRDRLPRIEATNRVAQHPLVLKFRQQASPGCIVFTSGSSGKPKAILHDFARLLKKFERPRTPHRTILFLLFDHLGGINTLLAVLAYGGVGITAERRTPESVSIAIEQARAELLPTTPAFLTMMVTSGVTREFDLSSLKLVTYGTDLMPGRTLEALVEEFPAIRFQQTYGLSEVGVLRSKSRGSGSLHMQVGGEGFETKIVDGVLWIRSQSAMVGYLNAPDPFDEEGWLNTGDLVEVDGDDIRILGRETDLINVGGQKVFPSEVEGVLMRAPNVVDAMVYAEEHPVLGRVVAARILTAEAEDPLTLRTRLRKFCLNHLAAFKVPVRFIMNDNDIHNVRFKKVRRADSQGQESI